jgi:hypothetical protein
MQQPTTRDITRSPAHPLTPSPASTASLTPSPASTASLTPSPAHPLTCLLLLLTILCCLGQLPNAYADHQPTLIARVYGPGLVSVSGQRLAEAGWDLAALDVAQLRVWRNGTEIPIELHGVEDGLFEVEDQIHWLASDGTRWSREEWYWLEQGAALGKRVDLPPTPTRLLQWSPDELYVGMARSSRGDRWFAGEVREGGPPLTITLTLPAPLPAGKPLRLAVSSLNRQPHQLVLSIYGQTFTLPTWNTTAANAGTTGDVVFSLPRPLPAGAITLTLALADGPPDAVLIDGLSIPELQVPLPFLQPALEPLQYATCSLQQGTCELNNEPAGATQIILADRAFHGALAPLIEIKQQQGLSVALLDPQAIYTTYNWGERDPEAIRAFLQHTQATWSPPPRSVLLVGAGGVRQRLDPAEPAAALVPPYLLDGDPEVGEFPCDSCYGRLDHADVRADLLPELAVGRLPIHTPAEAALLSAKIAAYLAGPPTGPWRARQLIVSDNDRGADGQPDPAGPFAPLTALAAAQLPTYQSTLFAYAPERPAEPPFYPEPGLLRQDFLAAFDQGAALLTYVGHGSPWQWAAVEANAEPPYLLSIYDTERQNGARLPVLLSMSCLSGQWSNPLMPSIDERLLLAEDGGIVASISPGGSGVNTGHSSLLATLAPALAEGFTLGEAMLSGYAALAASGRNGELRYSYNLLGDPELRLVRPEQQLWLPLISGGSGQ